MEEKRVVWGVVRLAEPEARDRELGWRVRVCIVGGRLFSG